MSTQMGEINEKASPRKSNNRVANILNAIAAITFILGFIAGISSGSIVNTIILWVGSFITGIIYIGFAEIINLLQELVDKGKTYTVKITSEKENTKPEHYNDLPPL